LKSELLMIRTGGSVTVPVGKGEQRCQHPMLRVLYLQRTVIETEGERLREWTLRVVSL